MRVLISGAGIAGPTLAWWLRRYGIEAVIVEHAPRLRTGGYVIDFWGAGFDIAEKMGILPAIREEGYDVKEVRIVDGDGRRAGGFSADVFRRLTSGRYVSIPRSALAATLFRATEGDVETIFGDSITSLEEREDSVRVHFERAAPRDFDVVVGADGLHSRVRELAFGTERLFEKYLGYGVAAFEVEGYRPRNELVYVMYTDVGRQIARFAMRGDLTMFLFVFADDHFDIARADDIASQKAMLRSRFRDAGWETRRILDELDRAESFYFDRVSQIRMDAWSRGRIGLVGDAACCVSLLGGQGSALAMIGAYVLAWELRRAEGDLPEAFRRYHAFLADFMREKQKSAEGFARFFAPKSRTGLVIRNQFSKLLSIRWIAELVARNGLLDRITLPEE